VGFLRRLGRRLAQTDEERLARELTEWAEQVPGTSRIRDVPLRRPVQVAGAVTRLTVRAVEGLQSLEAVVSDGTGELTAAWLGRTSIPGLVLGTRVALEGVVGDKRGGKRMVNPRYEFA
jgi:RecG-like helicase